MSFKENLLTKMRIDQLADTVAGSIGLPGGERRIDREAAKELLSYSALTFQKERDMDLYISESKGDAQQILVLDNEFAFYRTTPEDVAMRKSPTVKEMLNVKNVFKILNDADVVVSKREDSVRTLQKLCISRLDLQWQDADIEAIAEDGRVSLERGYRDGVTDSLTLFAELLNYKTAPKPFRLSGHHIIGKLTQTEDGQTLFGPVIFYHKIRNTLKYLEERVNTLDRIRWEQIQKMVSGKDKSAVEGGDVFTVLKNKVADTGGKEYT